MKKERLPMAGLVTGVERSENLPEGLATRNYTASSEKKESQQVNPGDTTQLGASRQKQPSLYDEGVALNHAVHEHYKSNPISTSSEPLPDALRARMVQFNDAFEALRSSG
jgi:hypothetical protein